MARKKIEPIENLGNKPAELTVQKSKPLFSLWRSDLTLPEFKILDTYLARIDSHNPDKRTVIFEKGELEKVLGVKKIDTPVLKRRLHNLMMPIDIEDNSRKKRFATITLFEEAIAEQDEYEQWNVKMTCTNSAMRYVFNVENLGYLRYKLRCITELTSRYTYIMFTYLESNRYRRTWEVSVDDLRELLSCHEECYKQFKVFNDRLLKRVHKEMHDKTECRYSYEPIKKGRSVVAIRFTLETLPEPIIADDPDQLTLDEWLSEPLGLIADALTRDGAAACEFSKEQLQELQKLLLTVPERKLPQSEEDSMELRRYHYLAAQFATMNRIDSEKPIRSRFLYFKKMLQRDGEEEA